VLVQEVFYEKGEVISRAGDRANHLYIIYKGEVRLPTETKRSGDYFGEQGLFSGEIRTVDAVAQDLCHMYVLSREALEKLMREVPEIGHNLITAYALELHQRDAELFSLKKALKRE